ncbi:MAG: hypothetical protein JWM82_1332 [Myxococcales bacterium]|nr:hypothetical protein [Myxococcales bacterium]
MNRLATFVPFAPLLGSVTLFAMANPPAPPPAAAEAYRVDVESWRAAREARLRAPDGWLTVVGLLWLAPGANRFGSAPDNEVRLPGGAPAHAGTLVVANGKVSVAVPAGSPLTMNGRPAQSRAVHTDAEPEPDVFGFASLTWQVIARGDRLGVRVRDRDNPARKTCPPPRWYPIAPAYRVVARLTPRVGSAELVVPDATGGKQTLRSPGTLTFTLAGATQHLDPVLDGDDAADQLVVFRDLTTAHETYGAGRFVRALRQADGTFVLDFNRAYSPPCALTPHATCPLPPPQNRLRISVEAGEKNRAEAPPP